MLQTVSLSAVHILWNMQAESGSAGFSVQAPMETGSVILHMASVFCAVFPCILQSMCCVMRGLYMLQHRFLYELKLSCQTFKTPFQFLTLLHLLKRTKTSKNTLFKSWEHILLDRRLNVLCLGQITVEPSKSERAFLPQVGGTWMVHSATQFSMWVAKKITEVKENMPKKQICFGVV